jgi:hypothetical protein
LPRISAIFRGKLFVQRSGLDLAAALFDLLIC